MSGTTAPRVYTWIDTPPIRRLTDEEYLVSKREYDEAMERWGEIDGGTDLAKRLNDHRGYSVDVARFTEYALGRGYDIYEYRIAGVPVAIMMVDLDDVLEIKNLFTHPGTENAGGIMIEFALNLTVDNPLRVAPGVIGLETYNEASTAAYKALGFKTYSGRQLVLEAAKSELWELVETRWKLKKYKDKRYLSAP